MPIPLISNVLFDGLTIPYASAIIKTLLAFAALYVLKFYFSGTTNPSERVLHGKVVIITGGTSGIGGAVARELAQRGAQLVILTRYPISDAFLVEYIDDLRTATNNELITAEQVDLADLHSIRKFATRWIDNAPPRRLDMLLLCADEMTPPGAKMAFSRDGAEAMTAVNYLSNFHLLSILSPALRAQPADRDVRVIAGVCSSYVAGDLSDFVSRAVQKSGNSTKGQSSKPMLESPPKAASPSYSSSKVYATTKLAMITFCSAFQKHLSAGSRPDSLPHNCRVICVDPGWTRTPGMQRYLTWGSLWGLLLYLITYPLWWLVLKSPQQGAQSFLWAAMDSQFGRSDVSPGLLVRECSVAPVSRVDALDENVQKGLWEASEKTIEALEKESAMKRAKGKTMAEGREKHKGKSVESQAERQQASRRSRKTDKKMT